MYMYWYYNASNHCMSKIIIILTIPEEKRSPLALSTLFQGKWHVPRKIHKFHLAKKRRHKFLLNWNKSESLRIIHRIILQINLVTDWRLHTHNLLPLHQEPGQTGVGPGQSLAWKLGWVWPQAGLWSGWPGDKKSGDRPWLTGEKISTAWHEEKEKPWPAWLGMAGAGRGQTVVKLAKEPRPAWPGSN